MVGDQTNLDGIDADVRKKALAAMPEEIDLLDALLLHLNHGTVLLSGRDHGRGLNFLAVLLIHRAFNSLWRAREDAVCGYGVQSLVLCRAALEDWATLCWVELHPEAVDRWLWAILEEVEQPKEWPPRFEDIWPALGERETVVRGAYNVLSKFGHPKSQGLRWLIHFDLQSTYFHVGGHFDQHDLRACLYFLVCVAQGFLERVARLQKRMLGTVDETWLEKGRELSKRAKGFVDRVGKEVLDQTAT